MRWLSVVFVETNAEEIRADTFLPCKATEIEPPL
jgi:hypothetical protein